MKRWLWSCLGFCVFPLVEVLVLWGARRFYDHRVNRMLISWLRHDEVRLFDGAHGGWVPRPPDAETLALAAAGEERE